MWKKSLLQVLQSWAMQQDGTLFMVHQPRIPLVMIDMCPCTPKWWPLVFKVPALCLSVSELPIPLHVMCLLTLLSQAVQGQGLCLNPLCHQLGEPTRTHQTSSHLLPQCALVHKSSFACDQGNPESSRRGCRWNFGLCTDGLREPTPVLLHCAFLFFMTKVELASRSHRGCKTVLSTGEEFRYSHCTQGH